MNEDLLEAGEELKRLEQEETVQKDVPGISLSSLSKAQPVDFKGRKTAIQSKKIEEGEAIKLQ